MFLKSLANGSAPALTEAPAHFLGIDHSALHQKVRTRDSSAGYGSNERRFRERTA